MCAQRSWPSRVILALLAVLASCGHTLADTWPQRPVRIIVPAAPGSGVSIAARLFAERLAERWKQPVFIENRPGADGLIGTVAFAAARDDHTLLYWVASVFTLYPLVQERLHYDPQRDVIPISGTTQNAFVIAASTQSKLDSLQALAATARAQPGKLNYNAGAGDVPYLFAGFLKSAGIEMVEVPYRDNSVAAQDLAGGRLDICVHLLTAVLSLAQSGKIRLLAVTGRQRLSIAPDVPTANEQGFPHGEFDGLAGFFGPRDLPANRRERIAADIRAVATDPSLVERLAALGQVVRSSTSAEFTAAIEERYAKMAAIVALLGNKRAQ